MKLTPEDDAEIRNLLARYCLLLDQDDVEQWVQLFTPDATYSVYGRAFVGHEGLRKMMSAAPGGLHLGGPPAIEAVDDDHALTQQNLLFMERSGGEMRRSLYHDELVRTNEGWRIATRRCQFITAEGLSDRPDR
jgi:3-phenylpropionate/cinnamic acid dioxygenase small subunit